MRKNPFEFMLATILVNDSVIREAISRKEERAFLDFVKNDVTSKIKYNQVANYIYLDTQVNKAISDDALATYFTKVKEQCETKDILLYCSCFPESYDS